MAKQQLHEWNTDGRQIIIIKDIDLVIDLCPVPAGGAAEVHHVAQAGRPGAGGQEGAHPEEGGWCGVAWYGDNDDDDAMVRITLLHYALYKIARF